MNVLLRHRDSIVVAVLGLVMSLTPTAVRAQELGSTWPGLVTTELSTIYVTDDSGAETTGRLLRFDPDAVVLLVDGAERRIESARVRRIQKRGDSLKNGALIGALIGGVFGLLSGGIADCPGSRSNCAAFRVTAPLLSAAFYAAVGTGIDALVQGRTTLYVAPASASAPLTGDGRSTSMIRAGIRVTFSW